MSKKNKILIGTLSILLVCALVAGFSYAYWRLTYTQTTSNKIATSCFSMELANEKNDITLESTYPISDEKGKTLTPYSFTITNTCDLFASYTINLEMLEGTTLNSKYIKTMINNEAITNLSTLETTDPSIEGATESRILFKGSLGSGDSTDYTFRLWMDSETEATDDSMNKILQAKISVVGEAKAYSPVENGFTNLAEALLVNEYQTVSLDTAKNNISNKQAVDFSKTAPIIEWQPVINSETQELSIVKADPALIGSYGIIENTTRILFGTSYTFDSTTGYYNLTNTDFYYPPNVDFASNDYYVCYSTLTPTANNTLTYGNGLRCSIIYKINSVTNISDSTITLSGGDIVTTKKYVFNVHKMYETELESDKSDKGLYEANDDYGSTYYYRGNVTNNYVKFANAYWRVVRINGDGSIRLIYAGNGNGNYGIGRSTFNSETTNPTYVGYMYSNILDTSYQDTITNDNDSEIKKKLDSWYKINIDEPGYSTYVADSGFCNDRSISTSSSGTGATSQETTAYAAYYRMQNYTPSLICQNKDNDLFTLPSNTIGNKKLSYPIGLITLDELSFAGNASGYINKLVFTYYETSNLWTITPTSYNSNLGVAYVAYTDISGSIGSTYTTNNSLAVRPVINLKADTEISGGIGTANDPFIIK